MRTHTAGRALALPGAANQAGDDDERRAEEAQRIRARAAQVAGGGGAIAVGDEVLVPGREERGARAAARCRGGVGGDPGFVAGRLEARRSACGNLARN
jgi:hypothetical protein